MKVVYIDREIIENAQNNFNISPVDTAPLHSSYYSDYTLEKQNSIEWDETLDYNNVIPPVKDPSARYVPHDF